MIDRPIYSRICKSPADLLKAGLACEILSKENNFPVEVIIRKWKPRRTDQQNRYLWGVVYGIISQETGNDVNDLHLYFLGEFFGWEDYEVMGMTRKRPRETSSKQIKARFSEYLEFVISKAASLGIVIPPPNHDYVPEANSRRG